MQGQQYAFVNPSGTPVVKEVALSPRLDTLDGKRLGLLWNRVFRGDETLPAIAEVVQERFSDVTVISWDELPQTGVADMTAKNRKETLGALADSLRALNLDAVVTGNAGCGACAAATARLAITAEHAGIPAVAVGSANFLALTKQLAQMEGLPDLRTAEYPGTLTIESAEMLRDKVTTVTANEVVEGLTNG